MLAREEWSLPKVQPVDGFSLESLIAWLEKQPAGQRYCFSAWNDCLLGQWLRSIDPSASAPNKLSREQPSGFYYRANGQIVDLRHFKDIALDHDQTFGAALERARDALDCKLSSPERA